jgi:ACS family glucarate transporter-like MFS transporter
MRVRYRVLGMLVLLSIITYLDRICIAVAASTIMKDLSITTEAWGWVLSAFFISYGVFEIPAGAAGDRWGQRKMLTRIVIWWSAFTCLTGMVSNYWLLLATRFLFGAGEAGAYPNASGSVGRWFPSHERARAQGFIWGASRIGGALSPLLVAPIIEHLHWRTAFVVFGAVGLVWAAGWYWWYRDWPQQHSAVTPEEQREIGPVVVTTDHQAVPWRKLFSQPQLWLIMFMYFTYVCGGIFYMGRLPEFLELGRGMSKDEVKWVYSLAFLMGAAGNLAGGFVCGRLIRTRGPWIGCCVLGSVSLAVAGLLLLAVALSTGKTSAAVLLILGFGVMDCMLPAAWAVCVDIGKEHAGAVSGAMNCAGQAGGALFTALYGYLVTGMGSYDKPIIPMACMMLVSSVVFLLINPARPLLPAVAGPPEERPACA